ncbi:MAG: tetratricopeptide repeat protein [Steroidobacteraceae bacterium]|jgi:tetratricopeptide (TPR) repeat protein|nr:tetratricopeptide repeat protein [Steroidobacteraceae bacterium]
MKRRTLRHALGTHAALLVALACVAGCETPGPPVPVPVPAPVPAPAPGSASAGRERPPAGPARPAAPAARRYALGTAAGALVTQARGQLARGEPAVAAATLERAMRIEPDNPLLWIELAKVRQAQGNAAQAEAMGRKALARASGDPAAEAAARRVIAESRRARGQREESRD